MADYLSLFAGRKINNKWYFFFSGSHLVLPRGGMQYNFYDSFSYEELSYLAYDQEFRNYIKNILNGKSTRNEKRFINDYSDIQECPKINGKLNWKCIDSLILLTYNNIYNGKMTKEEIAEIQKAMDESVRPPEPPKETKEWWQFWKEEPKIPIFESDEWKNYLKKKLNFIVRLSYIFSVYL